VLVLGAVFVMAQFLQAVLGVDSFGAGLRILPWTGTMFLVGPVAGRLADRVGGARVAAGGLAVAATGYLWLTPLAQPGVSYAALVTPMVVIEIGNSAVFPALSAAIAGAVTSKGSVPRPASTRPYARSAASSASRWSPWRSRAAAASLIRPRPPTGSARSRGSVPRSLRRARSPPSRRGVLLARVLELLPVVGPVFGTAVRAVVEIEDAGVYDDPLMQRGAQRPVHAIL
jgi:hypothetical protein